jgi:para-nitrobenzyl esterase
MHQTWITRRAALNALSGTLLLGVAGRLMANLPEMTAAIETRTGKLRGRRIGGVSAFLGIPYGTDTSTHRFQPARAPAPWSGVRDCFAIGHQAPQMEFNAAAVSGGNVNMNSDFMRRLLTATRQGMEVGNESEDCLVLNVYTPDASHRHKRPVMFWMHGGGFAIGSGGDPQYSGEPLARRGDVVVVTVNHRLNALGYLYLGALHEDFADSGNVGQLDLILALQWVHDNIAAFGGDPGNVMIFGQSGGGAKVSATLAMPPAHGLFHKAAIQSGPGLKMVERADAAEHAERTLAALGVAPADVHRLQTMEYSQIIQAAAAAQASASRGTAGRLLSPVVDGRSLPRHPFEPDAPAISRDIPLMIGTCKDEATLFMSADPMFGHATQEQARARFNAMLGDRGPAAFDVYKSLRPNDEPTYWLTSMSTGMGTWMNSIRLAERKLAQHSAAVYMYRLDWEPPFLDGVLKTPHGTEVPLVFDTVDARRLVLGTGPEPGQIAASMSQAWINFARGGNPSQRALAWPTYDIAARKTMIFNTTSHVVSDPDRPAREFWSAQ